MRYCRLLIAAALGVAIAGCFGPLADQSKIESAVHDIFEGTAQKKVEAIAFLVAEDTRSPRALEALRGATGDSVAHVRVAALRALAALYVPVDTMLPFIGRGLTDPDYGVRYTAVDLLTIDRYQDPRTLDLLIAALRDSNAALRSTAAVAIGRLGPEGMPAMSALSRATRDSDEMVRHEARDAIDAITRTRKHHAP